MKIDFKKTLDSYKAKKNEFRIIDIPPMKYLMIDGHGDPNNSKEFASAIETLYPIAYKIKFISKLELNKDFVVNPLEGLWWAEDMNDFTVNRDKSKWDWTLMIMQPDWISIEIFNNAKEKLSNKNISNVDKVRFEILDEGKVVQVLHVGSFDDESEILDKMHNQFIPENNLKMVKKHHEIYLSDFRKVAQDKLKTILRQPVEL